MMAPHGIAYCRKAPDIIRGYPLVVEHSYQQLPFVVDFPYKMVVFHSYVKLPEGIILSRLVVWNMMFDDVSVFT